MTDISSTQFPNLPLVAFEPKTQWDLKLYNNLAINTYFGANDFVPIGFVRSEDCGKLREESETIFNQRLEIVVDMIVSKFAQLHKISGVDGTICKNTAQFGIEYDPQTLRPLVEDMLRNALSDPYFIFSPNGQDAQIPDGFLVDETISGHSFPSTVGSEILDQMLKLTIDENAQRSNEKQLRSLDVGIWVFGILAVAMAVYKPWELLF